MGRVRNLLFPAALTAALLSGCTTNPITGRSQFVGLVSEGQAIQGSAQAYQQLVGQLDKKKQVERDSARAQKVQEITDRLIAQAIKLRPKSAGWKWEVQLINDPKTVNAFCMAGGKMAIYTGLLEQLKATDDEIAQVMGHEISHALADHTRERMSVAQGTSAGVQILGAVAGMGRVGTDLMQNAAVIAIGLPNSRESESEADQIGIEIAARAGFDPKSAVTLWEKMGKLGGGRTPQFLSTHPSPENRAAKLKELGAKVEPLYLAAKSNPPQAQRYVNLPSVRLGSSNERVVEPPLGANERVIKPAPGPEPAKLAAAPAVEPDGLADFRRGAAVLDCREPCSVGYLRAKPDWRRLYDRQQWSELAASVLQAGYLSDYSYFLLAEAAKGLKLPDASKRYYQRALDAGKEYGCGANCDGFDVQKRVKQALAQK